MRPSSSLAAALLSLAATAGADPTWPHVNDELEEIMFQTAGFRARLFTDNVRQCANEASGPGRKNAAEWLRTGFHDMSTANRFFRTGGLDGSLQYELNSGENAGPGLTTTLRFLGGFLSSRSSLSDLIAMGVYASVRSCGGLAIPVRGGRIDATEAGTVGVPQTQNPTSTFVTQFDRMGFNQAEMIQLVACGHTLGSVHSEQFPDIVPPGTGVNGAVPMDSTDAAFDNKVVTEYLDGTTTNPLVVGPSVQLRKNADGRVFGADGNVTMNALRDAANFQTTCRNILQRMIEVVPAGVTMTDPITPYTVKPIDLQLTLAQAGSTLQWTGYIRVRTTTIPLNTITNVVLTYATRDGGSGATQPTLTVQGTGTGLDDTWAFFPINHAVPAASGISSFRITINKNDGTSEQFDNNGAWYPLTDAVLLQRPQSCLLQGSGALTLKALVRNDRADLPVNLGITYTTPKTGGSPVPQLNKETIPMTKGDCSGAYTWYSATYTITGGRSFAAKLDVESGSGSSILSDSFNTASDLGGTCAAWTGSQTCSSVTVSTTVIRQTTTTMTSTSCCTVTSTSTTSTSATPSSTGLSHRPTVGSSNLVGCYTEGSGTRALKGATFAYDGMTLDSCSRNCTGFAYWGTEYGRECYCGNSIDSTSNPANIADCNMACSGDGTQYCGGSNRLELYVISSLSSTSTTSTTATTTTGSSTTTTGSTSVTSTTTTATPSATPTGPTRVQSVANGKFFLVGCYTEGSGVRALTDRFLADDNMTLDMCATFCSAYNYWGTEYGRECYCGNNLAPSSSHAATNDCSMTCGGDRFQYCGGPNRLELYQSNSSASSTTSSSSTSSKTSSAPASSSSTTRDSASSPTSSSSSSLSSSESATSKRSAIPSPSSSTTTTTTSSSSSTDSSTTIKASTTATTTSQTTTATTTAAPDPASPTNMATVTAGTSIFTYTGCYSEPSGARALTGGFLASDSMTIQQCADYCKAWAYFGLEYERECFCGNSVAAGANSAPALDCQMRCKGDASQICGGPVRLSIYTIQQQT